jgi:hypothetical protein
MRTLTAMFDTRAEAENARQRLASAGISQDNVTIFDKTALAADVAISGAASHYGNHADADDRGVSHGHPPEGRADGSEGVHRNILGDFIDNRTGEKIGADAGSDRNAFGDFVDDNNERRGDQGTRDVRDSDRSRESDHRDAGSDTGIWASIKQLFSGDDHVYEEGMRRGGYLVTARVDDGLADSAHRILGDDANVDLDARQTEWQRDGWTGSRDEGRATGRVGSYDSTDWQRR